MIPKTEDGRVLFAVPWHDRVVVGTTDTPVAGTALEPRALPEEREFLMHHAARYLTRDPQPADVLSIYAGLRPLVKHGSGKNTAALSATVPTLMSKSGLVTVTGGKWTTYRKMAQDVVDHVEAAVGLDQHPCETETLQLHGWTRESIPERHLQVYGSDAAAVREVICAEPERGARIHPELEFMEAEVLWHVRHEMARTVEDVLARRTRALLLHARAAREAAPAVASLMARELGKPTSWAEGQVRSFQALAQDYIFA